MVAVPAGQVKHLPDWCDMEHDRERILQELAEVSRQHAIAKEDLASALVDASEAGASLREIGEATGIPHVTVGRIIKRASNRPLKRASNHG